jgi:hypothetical protein
MYEVGVVNNMLKELCFKTIPLKKPPWACCLESNNRRTWNLFMKFRSLGKGRSDVSFMGLELNSNKISMHLFFS